jgi:hypothetical protein
MANPNQLVDDKELKLRIREILLEWNPSLANDPQKLENIASAIQQDFYALAQKTPELLNKSMIVLNPLLEFLTAKQLELNMHPGLRPDPIRALQKKCDELIKEICRDNPDLELQLKKVVKEAVGQAANPANTGEAVNTLNNLYTILKHMQKNDKFNMKPLFEFLSDKDKANIIYFGETERGSHKTILSKMEANPFELKVVNEITKFTTAATKNDEEPETNYKTPKPFNIHSGPTKE